MQKQLFNIYTIALRKLENPAWAGLLVFITAFAVRIAYLIQSSDNPTFLHPVVDSYAYNRLALQIAEGKTPAELFWQPVFYPCFLGTVYRLLPGGIWTAKILQAVLGGGTCLLTFLLGRLVLSHREGVISGLIMAFYGPAIFLETELLGEGWALFWFVLLLFLLLPAQKSGSPWLLLGVGVCGAMATLTRPPLLAVFIACCAGLAFGLRRRFSHRDILIRLWLIAVGFGVPALHVAYFNQSLTGHFGIMPSSAGINLYIGNNPNWMKTVTIRPGADWDDLINMPVLRGIRDPWERSAYYQRLVVDYVRQKPALFFNGIACKAVRFVNSREIPRNVDIYVFRKSSSVLKTLVWKIEGFGFPFGVLLPLALLAAVAIPRRIPFAFWATLLVYPGIVVMHFVSGRYRILVVPVMAILAAGGLTWLAAALRERRWKSLGLAAMLLLAAAVLSSFPREFVEENSAINYEAELYRCIGRGLYEDDKPAEALPYLQTALRMAPEFVDALNETSIALLRLGRTDEALTCATRALQLRPNDATLVHNLGVIHVQTHDLAEAERLFREAILLDPRHFRAHANLGACLMDQGKIDEAIGEFRIAMRLNPLDPHIAQRLYEATATKHRSRQDRQ